MKKLSFMIVVFAITVSHQAFAGTKITASLKNKNTIQIRVKWDKTVRKYSTSKHNFSNINSTTQQMTANVACSNKKYALTKLEGTLYSKTKSSGGYRKNPISTSWHLKGSKNGVTWSFKNVRADTHQGGTPAVISTGLRQDGAEVCNLMNKGGKHKVRIAEWAKRINFIVEVWCKKPTGVFKKSKKFFYRKVRVQYRCEGK